MAPKRNESVRLVYIYEDIKDLVMSELGKTFVRKYYTCFDSKNERQNANVRALLANSKIVYLGDKKVIIQCHKNQRDIGRPYYYYEITHNHYKPSLPITSTINIGPICNPP